MITSPSNKANFYKKLSFTDFKPNQTKQQLINFTKNGKKKISDVEVKVYNVSYKDMKMHEDRFRDLQPRQEAFKPMKPLSSNRTSRNKKLVVALSSRGLKLKKRKSKQRYHPIKPNLYMSPKPSAVSFAV